MIWDFIIRSFPFWVSLSVTGVMSITVSCLVSGHTQVFITLITRETRSTSTELERLMKIDFAPPDGTKETRRLRASRNVGDKVEAKKAKKWILMVIETCTRNVTRKDKADGGDVVSIVLSYLRRLVVKVALISSVMREQSINK